MRTLLILLLFPSLCFAAANDIRISDGDDHVADIASDGSLMVSTTNEGVVFQAGARDIRISDSDDDVLDINSDGSITLVVGQPY